MRDAARNYAYGMSYAPHGALSAESLGNGASHSFTYNSRLQMQQIKLSVGGAERQRFEYLYGVVNAESGAVDTTRNNGQTNRFASGVTYDGAGQITADHKFRNTQYRYDANGRVDWSAYTNGMVAAASDYDGEGQRVATTSGGLTRHFVYNVFGQVIADYQPAGGWERDYVYRGGLLLATVEASGGVRYVTPD